MAGAGAGTAALGAGAGTAGAGRAPGTEGIEAEDLAGAPGAAGAGGRGAVDPRASMPGGAEGRPAGGVARSGLRRSRWSSLSSKPGTFRTGGWAGALAQAGQSPTGGSGAPHFRHLDNGSSGLEKAVAT